MFFKKAQPVWAKGKEKQLNVSLSFESIPLTAGDYRLKITASSFYRVKIDGVFFGYGPARCAHGYFRVDEYDFSAAENANVQIEVVGYNTKSFYSLDQPSFLQAEVMDKNGNPVIFTGENNGFNCYETDRLSRVLRFSYQRPFTEYYVQKEVHEKFDTAVVNGGRLLARNTDYPRYDDCEGSLYERGVFTVNILNEKIDLEQIWTPPTLKIYPFEQLERCAVPFVNSLEYTKREKRTNRYVKGEYAVYGFNRCQAGFIGLDLIANEKSTVHIVFDEINSEEDGKKPAKIDYLRNSCYNIVSYELLSGKHSLLSFEPYSFGFIKIIVAEGCVDIERVYIKKYEHPFFENYKFKCSDKKIEEVIISAARTFAHNSVDILTDCPSRERAGFLCDSFFSGRAERFFTGENRTERNFLENYAISPKLENVPENMLPMCYPADFDTVSFIPNWAMWFVLELNDYYNRTKDDTLVKLSRKKIDGLLEYFARFENEFGLLENLEGWVFVEWSKANDFVHGINFPSNMLYSAMIDTAADLYMDLRFLKKKAERIRCAIRELSFNGKFFEDNAVREDGKIKKKGNITETCQYYAFFFKVADKNGYAELFETLVSEFGPDREVGKMYPDVFPSNAFIGNYLRLSILLDENLKERVLNESLEYFYKMAIRTGTLWEHDKLKASLDHGFASYAAYLLANSLR